MEKEKILLIRHAAVVHRPHATVALAAKAREERMGPRKTCIRPKLNAVHAVGPRPVNGPLHKLCPPGTAAQGRF